MEDTCAVVLKHCAFNVEYTDTDEKQKQDHALEVMMDFVEPLVKELSVASDTQEETDVFRQVFPFQKSVSICSELFGWDIM